MAYSGTITVTVDKSYITVYVARLFAREITLMQQPRNPRKAGEMPSRILREAFRE